MRSFPTRPRTVSRPCKLRRRPRHRNPGFMASARSIFSLGYCRSWAENVTGFLVLLLAPSPASAASFSPTFLVLTLLLVSFSGVPAVAAERTFVLAPADLVSAPDLFGAKALSLGHPRSCRRSEARRGALREGVCPSLLADPTRHITRVRLLGSPTGAPLVVGRSVGRGLTNALTLMSTADVVGAGERGDPPSALGRRCAGRRCGRIHDGRLRGRRSDRRARHGRWSDPRARLSDERQPRGAIPASVRPSSRSRSRPSCHRRSSGSPASAPSASSWRRCCQSTSTRCGRS